MLMLKFQCNILNNDQYEGSRDLYVQILYCVQFRMDFINYLWIFPCNVCTYPAVHLLFHGIRMYSIIFSNVNIFMAGWKNVWSSSKALTLQQWFGLTCLCLFQILKTCLVFICFLCLRCIYYYRRKILTTIFMSKDELIRYLLDSVFDG